jgi:hypothetical protein
MTEEPTAGTDATPPVRDARQIAMDAALAAKGPEFLLAMDLPRIWSTGAQAMLSPDFGLLVFREQNFVQFPDQPNAPTVKNVASIVMPLSTLREMHKQIGEALATLK